MKKHTAERSEGHVYERTRETRARNMCPAIGFEAERLPNGAERNLSSSQVFDLKHSASHRHSIWHVSPFLLSNRIQCLYIYISNSPTYLPHLPIQCSRHAVTLFTFLLFVALCLTARLLHGKSWCAHPPTVRDQYIAPYFKANLAGSPSLISYLPLQAGVTTH